MSTGTAWNPELAQPRTSVLGGQTKERRSFGSLSGGAVGILALLGLGWIIAILVTTASGASVVVSLIVIGGGLVLGFVLVKAMTRVTDEGDGWLRAALLRGRARVHDGITILGRTVIAGRQLWVPEAGEVPAAVRQFREIDVPTSAGTVSLIHHPDPRRGYEHGHLTGVLEIIGGGDGLREIHETNRRGEKFGLITRGHAGPQVPVEQLDIETRVLPTDPEEYRRHVEGLLKDDIPPALRESMRELTEFGAGTSETYRSFVTVRMPLERLHSRSFGREDLGGVVDTATETLRGAAERLMRAGYDVRSVLSPRRVGAYIRHLYVPSYGVDQLDGLETTADAFAFFGYDHGPDRRSLAVEAGPAGEWFHAVGSIPLDGWPLAPVGMRWLEGLVTDTERAVVRTVKAQHRLIAPKETQSRAAVGKTLDDADLNKQDRTGQTSTGEREEQASAAGRVLADIIDGAAGDVPSVRVLVSGRTPYELEDARSVVEGAADDMLIRRLRWYDGAHDLAMITMLPFGRGVKLA